MGLYTILLKGGALFLVGVGYPGGVIVSFFNVGVQCTTTIFIHIAFVLFDMQLKSILNFFA